MAKAVGQFTITDLNDVNISTTAPADPVLNQLWLDSSAVPNVLRRWDGSAWLIVNDVSDKINAVAPFIKGTQIATTASWTGVAPFESLENGQQITYLLPQAPTGSATLNLTLKGGATTGAINCYYLGASRLTTHFGQGNVIRLTYLVNNRIGATDYTGWWADAAYADGNTIDRIQYNRAIKAKTAITAGYLVVADNTGSFFHLAKDVPFEIDKPILYASAAIALNATGTSNYTVYPNGISVRTNSGNGALTLTAYKALYIEGTLNGLVFTPIGTTLYTDTPTNNDSVYMLIGQLYDTYRFSLVGQHEMYRFTNGVFKSFAQIAAEADGKVDGLTGRVTTAEQKITPTAITQTVESQVTANGSVILATKGDITLTDEAWTAKFGQIGGTNLAINSKNSGIGWNYPLSYILASGTMSKDWIPGKTYTVTLKGTITAPNVFRFYRDYGYAFAGALSPIGNDIHRLTFVCPALWAGQLPNTFRFYNYPSSTIGPVIIEWIKIEEGAVATDWSPAADELYTGITKIDKDGAHFGKSGETVETGVAYDGLRIKDGEIDIAAFTDAGAVIGSLQALSIAGDVLNTLNVDNTFTIGSGKQYPTINACLNDLRTGGKNPKILDESVTLKFDIYGAIQDIVFLHGYQGGTIEFNFQAGATLIGHIYAQSCTSRILIHGQSSASRAVITRTSRQVIIEAYACSYIQVYWMNFDNGGYANSWAIRAMDGTTLRAYENDFGTCEYGFMVYNASVGFSKNNKGTHVQNGLYVSEALMMAVGTQPNGNGPVYNGGQYLTNGTITPTNSTFSAPPTSDKTFSDTFSPTKISTYSVEFGADSTYYGSSAAQNRWDTTTNYFKGRIAFGANLFNYIADRKAGTTPTVKIRLRRKNSTHGSNYGPTLPSPYPENFTPSPAFGPVARGAWTDWVTIPYTLITSGGYVFSLYNGTTGNSYAIFDSAEISVTKIKNV